MAEKTNGELITLYGEKNYLMHQYCDPVDPYDFYRDLFPVGSFERAGHYEDEKPNGIVLELGANGRHRRTVTDDLNGFLEDVEGRFVITSPISYFGNSRSAANARWIYALAFDLDGVGLLQLEDVMHQMNIEYIPKATYIVNSGTGLHLYYFLDERIPMYPQNQRWLRQLKEGLTKRIWNQFTSLREEPQYQGIVQGYRVIGSATKIGEDFPVRAFRFSEKRYSIEELLNFTIMEKDGIKKLMKKSSTMSLEEAKEKYPEWYENRGKRRMWTCHRGLYDWWLDKIKHETKVGHRYFNIMFLAVYAIKSGISEDEFWTDAQNLVQTFDELTTDELNHFTLDDIMSAAEAYNDCYATFPRREIEKLSGIPIPPNKRNGRTRAENLVIARTALNVDHPNGSWINRKGRPTAESTVKQWQIEHPDGRKADCIRDTKLSKPTVYKWWNSTIR